MKSADKKSEYFVDRINSKGEAILRRNTNQTKEHLESYLKAENIRYDMREGAKMVWLYVNNGKYAYYWTTGRWAAHVKGGFPKKHYRSNGIEDLMTRFLKKNEDM
jgi:hypothetical protein